MKGLKGKTVVVTGASSGIGEALARECAVQGANVVLGARSLQKLQLIVGDIRSKGGEATYCAVDVTRPEECRNLIDTAVGEYGGGDVLICNAGVVLGTGLMSMMSPEDWDRIFAVNVKGVYNCVNGAMPYFLRKHSGSIITVSSMWGRVGASCEVAYSATKGAVIAMTKALAKELGPSGIRCNCVAPGVIMTDMCGNIDPEILEEMAEESPVGRNGTPMDVAKAFAYLADAEFVTGHVLSVDGGYAI